jgi:hypothetical protein
VVRDEAGYHHMTIIPRTPGLEGFVLVPESAVPGEPDEREEEEPQLGQDEVREVHSLTRTPKTFVFTRKSRETVIRPSKAGGGTRRVEPAFGRYQRPMQDGSGSSLIIIIIIIIIIMIIIIILITLLLLVLTLG